MFTYFMQLPTVMMMMMMMMWGLMSLGVGLTVLLLGTKLPKREAVSWRQETGFCLFTS